MIETVEGLILLEEYRIETAVDLIRMEVDLIEVVEDLIELVVDLIRTVVDLPWRMEELIAAGEGLIEMCQNRRKYRKRRVIDLLAQARLYRREELMENREPSRPPSRAEFEKVRSNAKAWATVAAVGPETLRRRACV
jgi:MoaA/NifB/PqqE/SkfB family radical SAM enzyme